MSKKYCSWKVEIDNTDCPNYKYYQKADKTRKTEKICSLNMKKCNKANCPKYIEGLYQEY